MDSRFPFGFGTLTFVIGPNEVNLNSEAHLEYIPCCPIEGSTFLYERPRRRLVSSLPIAIP